MNLRQLFWYRLSGRKTYHHENLCYKELASTLYPFLQVILAGHQSDIKLIQ